MEDRVVDRELDDEKDVVVWDNARKKKKTKANLEYESLLTETAPRYNAAKEHEKKPIAEQMVASLGLSFVHLRDGRVRKELGKDKVVSRTMRKLREEAREPKSQARLPDRPPDPPDAGETAIVHSAPSNARGTAIGHSAPRNTGVTWNETAMQALANPQRPVSFTNVTGGQTVQHFAGGETVNNTTVNNYTTNDNSLDLDIIKQQLGNIEGKLDSNRDELRSNRDELRSILKEHKEKVDHLEETVSVQNRVINDKDRVIKELRERIDHLEKTVNALSSNQQIIMRVNDKENKRGAEINALREVQQGDPTSGSKQRKIRNRDDADVSELEDETMSC